MANHLTTATDPKNGKDIVCVVGEQSQVVEIDHNKNMATPHLQYRVTFNTLIIIICWFFYFEREMDTERHILGYSVALNTVYNKLTFLSVCFRAEAYAEKSEFIIPLSLFLSLWWLLFLSYFL